METTINLQDLLTTIRKRWFLILSFTVFAGVTATIISYYVLTPIYQSETQILINQKSTNIEQYQWVQNNEADLRLINTYNIIITSPIILSKVIEKLDLDQTPNSLAEQITVTSANNSQVVNLVVIDNEASMAVKISNTLAEVFQNEIPLLMNVDNIKILSEAKLVDNPTPIKPNKLLNITIAAVIGLMLGTILAFLLDFLDTRFKSEQEVEEILGLPIIGLVGAIGLEKETKKSKKSDRVRGS
ncbi:capsular biosynthesis protein [Lysinibacillus contaminans]|uniref:Capsular biosynthesis protein n=1 Tax=Lysinibacillus contaminans TaxID=1293441 RepID=A0ABR5K3U0_9BACI|nr:Wzz/FepE/Etk N-terminal domain-containing protein [Lysinibacillus contaminans]KOS69387.1 capsular biosynthesis protein [Lysinibacillus contaminans]